MEEKLNLILKVLALRLRLDYGFSDSLVENLVREIDKTVMRSPPVEKEKVIIESITEFIPEEPKPKRGRPCKPR